MIIGVFKGGGRVGMLSTSKAALVKNPGQKWCQWRPGKLQKDSLISLQKAHAIPSAMLVQDNFFFFLGEFQG